VGPGAHNAHAALQHVHKLGQLVEAAAPQKGAQGGDARIAFFGLRDMALAFVVHVHAAKLVDLNFFAIPAVAFLFEDDGALGGELHGQGHAQQDGRYQNQNQAGHDAVFKPLHNQVEARHGRARDVEHGHAQHHAQAVVHHLKGAHVGHQADVGRAVAQLIQHGLQATHVVGRGANPHFVGVELANRIVQAIDVVNAHHTGQVVPCPGAGSHPATYGRHRAAAAHQQHPHVVDLAATHVAHDQKHAQSGQPRDAQ